MRINGVDFDGGDFWLSDTICPECNKFFHGKKDRQEEESRV
jgi:hypothetical protein